MNILDCRGQQCPQPVINTKKYFDSVENVEAVVIVDNETARNNVVKLATSSGLKYSIEEKESCFHITLCKGAAGKLEESQVLSRSSRGLTIVITSDRLGVGDDALGTMLMKSYLYALSENDSIPEHLVFLNSGVKLTTEGAENIDNLRKLQQKGTEIMSCGTCLDFYGLKEKLLVGEVGNMYTIVEIMNTSSNTIKL
ncbi:MAG: sulfurtransferase-like selenium metabolism protein YedF [Bacillota bacterium]|nr:sulfurtransferase-like selenium metabolism protein YedF [Bacillota bacterium]